MHRNQILHRDIKLENIIIESFPDGNSGNLSGMKIKITDFGFSEKLQENEILMLSIGSRFYMSPETLSSLPYRFKIDVWGATVVVFILLCGDMPFTGQNFE